MKLSEAPRGTYLKFNSLVFFALGNNQFIVAMPGDTMKQGVAPCDMDLPVITRNEYLAVSRLAAHGDDYTSMILGKAIEHGIEKDELLLESALV